MEKEKRGLTIFAAEALRVILNNINDAIFIHELDGTIIDVNEKMLELYRVTREEALKYSIAGDFSTPSNPLRTLPRTWEKVVEGEKQVFEWEARRPKDGSMFYVQVSLHRLSLDDRYVIMAVVQDITERKNAEKVLQRSEEMHRTTFENTGTAMATIAEDGKIALVNQQMETFTGYYKRELAGMNYRKIIHPDDLIKLEPILDGDSDGEGVAGQCEIRIINRMGKVRHVFLNTNVIPRTRWRVMSKVDITEFKKMENMLKESKNKVQRIHDVAVKMGSTRSCEDVCRLIVDAAKSILNMTSCAVDLVEGDMLVVKATSEGGLSISPRDMPIDHGISGKTYSTGKTFLINDLDEMPEIENQDDSSIHSLISVPIGRVGIFQAVSDKANAFSSQDVEMVELLVAHAAEAIKRIHSEERIRYMSFHDSLTGLYNRAFFEEELKRLDTKRQLPLSIIIADVNGLKLINDTFGHQEGDKILTRITKRIQESCRKEDIVCRWGGDEFAILLPRTPEETCQDIVNRIEKACSGCERGWIPLSISLGWGVKLTKKKRFYDVIKVAEERMYRKKLTESMNYRNKVLEFLKDHLFQKSNETEEHVQELQKLGERVGEALSLSEGEIKEIKSLAALHDIGHIAIPEKILMKPDKLNEDEWKTICQHPEIGYRIVEASPEKGSVAYGILAHHEWWNGEGYPRGLKGKDIPLTARIISIIDAYDVMVRGRPYKDPVSKKEALEEIKRCAGSQFDPELVEVFCQIVEE